MSPDKEEKKPAKTTAKPKKALAAAPASKAAAKKAVSAPKKEAAPKAAEPKPRTAVKSAVAAGIPEVAKRQPSHDEIARRAYFIYVERHGQHGHHESDWLRAERELLGL